MPTHAPAGKMSGSHSSSRSVHVSVATPDTVGASGEAPHEIGTLNAYIYFFQLSVALIYIDFKFTYN